MIEIPSDVGSGLPLKNDTLARIGSTQQNNAAYLQATLAVESSSDP